MDRKSKPTNRQSMISSVPSESGGRNTGSNDKTSSLTNSPQRPRAKAKPVVHDAAIVHPPKLPDSPRHGRKVGNFDSSVPPPLPSPRVKEVVAGVSLSNVMDTSKNGYPIVMSVSSGAYGSKIESSLYQEEITIHFEMRVKVIEALFEKGGSYMIPVCSANQFSVLFNPGENTAQALMGYYYETVGHILAKQQKPKVICATRPFKSSLGGAVQEGEILIIQKIQKRNIKCLNVVTNEEKKLHESCAGAFTTQPEKIKLSLKEIIKNIDLPLKVIMYHQLPHVVLSKHVVVTLLNEKWEESVIASRGATSNDTSDQLIRLTKDIGINFAPQSEDKMDQAGYYSHCRETCHVYKEFNYSTIHLHLFHEDPVWPNHEEIQSSLYSHVESVGDLVELRRPDKAFKTSGRQPSVIIETPPNKPDPIDDMESPIPDSATILHTVNTVNRQMMISVESLRAEVEGLKMELRQMKNLMSSIKRELPSMVSETVKYELQKQTPEQCNEQDECINSENMEILKGFTHEQVLQALEKLSLKRCLPVFKRKKLTGADLVQYNKSRLEVEFGMNSKLDILRLLKLIQGCSSIWNLLESPSES